MEAAGVISIVWFVGSIFACVVGCHRSRVLGRKVKALEEKLEKSREPTPFVYSVPISPQYAPPPSAPSGSYDTRIPVKY